MIKTTTIFAKLIAAGALSVSLQSASSQILYQNTTVFLGDFNYGNGEAGNDVSFAGTFPKYLITSFVFQFDFTDLSGSGTPSGNEMADLRLYVDSLALSPSDDDNNPGNLFYDSGTFAIGGYTEASTVTFRQTDLNGGVVVPGNFTWTVTFSGLTPTETAGLALYSPASTGTNFDQAWFNNGTNWQLLTASGDSPPPVFGAAIIGAPLPKLQFTTKSNLLVLSWPTFPPHYNLQIATNLTNPINWLPVSNYFGPKGENLFTNANTGLSSFYRLIYNTSPQQ